MPSEQPFKPALIVVDFQEDFCPPAGSLAVQGGRDIAPVVNSLLELPYVLKIVTKDFHPPDHISFASNHAAPNNKAFATTIIIQNPNRPEETEEALLWPDHCVQGTDGAELVPELDTTKVDHVIEKGQDKRVEMYSAFQDPFPHPLATTQLARILHDAEVTDVHVVGLAFDYCVKCTAADAHKEGFKASIIREGTRAVDPNAVESLELKLQQSGVEVIAMEGPEVNRVRRRLETAANVSLKPPV